MFCFQTTKAVVITVSNKLPVSLTNPRVCLLHGKVTGIYPREIKSGEFSCFTIRHTTGSTCGVGGVVTFDLHISPEVTENMCLYVYNPIFSDGQFNLKWKEKIDDHRILADKMATDSVMNDNSAGVEMRMSDVSGFRLSASMSHDNPIRLHVDVSVKGETYLSFLGFHFNISSIRTKNVCLLTNTTK